MRWLVSGIPAISAVISSCLDDVSPPCSTYCLNASRLMSRDILAGKRKSRLRMGAHRAHACAPFRSS